MSHVRQGVQEEAERGHPSNGRARSDQGGPRHARPIGIVISSVPWSTHHNHSKLAQHKDDIIALHVMYNYDDIEHFLVNKFIYCYVMLLLVIKL